MFGITQKQPRSLRWTYLLVVLFMSLLTILAYGLIAEDIDNSKADSSFIDFAGRQRARCQRIPKDMYVLFSPKHFWQNPDSMRQEARKDLELMYLRIVDTHQELLERNQNTDEHPEIKAWFAQVEPSYLQLVRNTRWVLDHEASNISADSVLANTVVASTNFLDLMDKIIKKYVEESEQKHQKTFQKVILIGLTFLGFLFFSYLWIIRPASKTMDLALQKEQQGNEELRTNEEKLKLNLTKLQKLQSDLIYKNVELEKSHAHIQAITDALDNSVLVSITDKKGNIVKVNDIFCQVSKYTFEELKGKKHHLLNSDQHSQEFWQEAVNSIKKGKSWRADVQNQAKDGSIYWVDMVINPIYDEKGNIYQYLSICSLITKRKMAEIEIKQKNEQIGKLLTDITSSLNYAKRIQRAMMPTENRLSEIFADHFVLFQPKNIVSGDFYFLAEIENKIFLAVSDCTGHGVPAAFMSILGIELLDKIINFLKIHSPDAILKALHQEIGRILQQEKGESADGMDISVLVLEKKQNALHLEYAGAMNPFYYVENGVFKEIKGTKQTIGGKNIAQERSFGKHQLEILLENENPFVFYLASDGYADQFGGLQKRKFMSKRFKELLANIFEKPMAEQKLLLTQNLQAWQGDGQEKQTDDITILGIRI